MTQLNRKLRREIPAWLEVDRFSRGRPIIVELEPPENSLPAQIAFRWKGTRRRYRAPVSLLMQWTIQAEAERVAQEKRKNRKAKRR